MKLRFSYCLNIELDFPKIYLLLLPSRQTPMAGMGYTSFKSFLTCRNDEQHWHVFCFIGWVWGKIYRNLFVHPIFDRKQPYFSVDILTIPWFWHQHQRCHEPSPVSDCWRDFGKNCHNRGKENIHWGYPGIAIPQGPYHTQFSRSNSRFVRQTCLLQFALNSPPCS